MAKSAIQIDKKAFSAFADPINDMDDVSKGIMQSVLTTFWEKTTDFETVDLEKALLLLSQSIEQVEEEEDVEWDNADLGIFEQIRTFLRNSPDLQTAIDKIEEFGDELIDELE